MIGIIPAAGHATRINGLPKFLLPLPRDTFLLDVLRRRMVQAGASPLLIGVNTPNVDLLDHYAAHYAYVHECNTATMSETVIQLGQFTGKQPVLFGMPDSYWFDAQVYQRLAACIDDGALVSVALFETRPEQRHGLGMCAVQFDEDDNLLVTRIEDKPQHTRLHLAWGALAWRAGFWQFIRPNDPHVGFAVQRALDDGRRVHGYLAYGDYYDCGTPNGYFDLIAALRERVA